MSRKKWCVSKFDKECAAEIAETYSLNPFTALLLVSRGFTSDELLDDFFSDEITYLTEPYELPDMEKAVERILKAIDRFEKIAIYGDYDADGVTSTAMLYLYLQEHGANVVCYIPDRNSEGYGMNKAAINKLYEDGVNLIITVDNGISAVEEAKLIHKLGMDLVITDHHRVSGELPEAVAVVDQHREEYCGEFRDWAGVGIVFKLIEALEDGDYEIVLEKYADLVAIGTIGDVMPVLSENRQIIRYGTRLINENARIGIDALRKAVSYENKVLSSTGIAFMIVPKINAAGRMGSAENALKLLLCDDEEEAVELAKTICEDNAQRQKVELEILAEAEALIQSCQQYKYDRVIVIDGKDWYGGVIGIVAARLTEKYGKPCIVISRIEGVGKGSGRSIEGFSLFEALENTSDLLMQYGGHTLAAGFEISEDNIEIFRARINEYAAKKGVPFSQLNIDCKVNPKYLTVELLEALKILEPYGTGNAQPIFGIYNMCVDKIEPVSNGVHSKLYLSRGESKIVAMRFGVSPAKLDIKVGDTIDIAANIDRNEYMGVVRVSIIIKAMKFSSMDDEKVLESIALYEKIKRHEKLTSAEAIRALPTRDLIGKVYKLIRANKKWAEQKETLAYRIGDNGERLCAVAVALDVLEELNLIYMDTENDCMMLTDNTQKVDLENSQILHEIKNMI